ncbi:hypothetical protein [Paenibacillus sp. CMAA1364]
MKRTIFVVAIISLMILSGCNKSQAGTGNESSEETIIDSVQSHEIVSEQSAKYVLNQLETQEFTIQGEDIHNNDDETIIRFGKSFVNLYNGAVEEQEKVSFDQYISNENLREFADKTLELTQKQDLQGGHGINYGLNNEFQQVKLQHIDDNLAYLELPFEFEGSGMSCNLLITAENKHLKIVDMYFGSKDGVDTFATGHPADRKLNDANLWQNQKWINDVFDKLKVFEEKLMN